MAASQASGAHAALRCPECATNVSQLQLQHAVVQGTVTGCSAACRTVAARSSSSAGAGDRRWPGTESQPDMSESNLGGASRAGHRFRAGLLIVMRHARARADAASAVGMVRMHGQRRVDPAGPTAAIGWRPRLLRLRGPAGREHRHPGRETPASPLDVRCKASRASWRGALRALAPRTQVHERLGSAAGLRS